MARRSKDSSGVEDATLLGGGALLFCFLSPTARRVIATKGTLTLFLLVLAVLGVLTIVVYRYYVRSKWKRDSESKLNCQPSRPDRNGASLALSETDFIKQLHAIDWFQFEKLLEQIYLKLDYTVTRRGGANPDGGVDLIVEWDGQRSAVQCKHWKTWNVGVKPIREFLGALTHAEIQGGIIVTLHGYTGEAKQLADAHRIEIINEAGLSKMIEDAGVRHDPTAWAILKDTRKVCPKCEKEMVLRTAGKGAGSGRQFWGCSAYPGCRFTLPAS